MSQDPNPTSDPVIPVTLVRDLAAYAALPLAPAREAGVAGILQAWVPEANALSAKMSQAQYQTLVPATVFIHQPAGDEETAA
jgi:hypothetical protein